MRKVACSIHDAKDDTYSVPVFYDSAADAIQVFCCDMFDESLDMFERPQDFALFQLGFWDNKKFRLINSRVLLINGSSYVKSCEMLARLSNLE